ncbi:MAG: metallophosphoesterase [Candidatus Wolframiiraptor sp.]|nr:MAG: metallophosphoesterase [Candidatus Wolframiiraptor sp.]
MRASKLRIFFASDLHGSEVCFKKFINAAEFYKANVIILGGDLTGKFIVPIFEVEGGRYRAKFANEDYSLTNATLEKFMQKVRDSGCYPYLTTKEEWEDLVSEESKMNSLFIDLMKDSIKRWVEYAETKLRGKEIQCYIMPGNDDHYAIDEILNASEIIKNPHEKVVNITDNLKMISLGYSNLTPWRCPRDITEEELEQKIEGLMRRIGDVDELIFNIHVPPYGSGIDSAPELDENMRPKLGPGGQIMMTPAGSIAVRKAIEKYQPLIGLHGHIHEAKGFAKIGRTLCFNPGSEYQEGILRGVLIQIDKGKVRDFIFTSG